MSESTGVQLARARIEPEKVDRVREWYAELERRESEVRAALDHEGVYTETAFVHEVDDTAYLHVYMEADDVQAADEAGDEEQFEIHEEHHEVLRETLAGEFVELESIGHFTNPDLRGGDDD
jgi:hypothetical protein